MPENHSKTRFAIWLNPTIILLVVAVVVGCSTPVGKTTFPQPSSEFVPRKVYQATTEEIWNLVIEALEANRIVIATSDKATGRLTTDYVPGIAAMHFGGLGGTSNTRYKYNLTIRSQGAQTHLGIICIVESAYSGDATIPFRDVGREVPDLVNSLETWLYEQIEKSLVN